MRRREKKEDNDDAGNYIIGGDPLSTPTLL